MSKFAEYVLKELQVAREKHAPIHSLHEGYAVLLEEVDELWERVKMKCTDHRGDIHAYRELIQIGTMAQRIAEDVIISGEVESEEAE